MESRWHHDLPVTSVCFFESQIQPTSTQACWLIFVFVWSFLPFFVLVMLPNKWMECRWNLQFNVCCHFLYRQRQKAVFWAPCGTQVSYYFWRLFIACNHWCKWSHCTQRMDSSLDLSHGSRALKQGVPFEWLDHLSHLFQCSKLIYCVFWGLST